MNRHWRRIWPTSLLPGLLIGLLIALLPLRGWAWATMPVATWEPPPCHASAHQADAPLDAAPDSAPDAAPNADESATAGASSHAGCTLCDLCHAGVISAPDWAWPDRQPPATAPSWAVSPFSGREGGDDLFKPPRG